MSKHKLRADSFGSQLFFDTWKGSWYLFHKKWCTDINVTFDEVDKVLTAISAEAREMLALFGGEPSVKLSKKSYEKLINMAESAGVLKRIIKGCQKDIRDKDRIIAKLKTMADNLNKKVDMLDKFLEKYNLIQKFKEFLKTNPIRFIQEHRGQYNERNKVEMIVSQKNSEIGR